MTKHLLRVARWVGLLWLTMTLAAWVSGGWVVTPLVYSYRDADVDAVRASLETAGEIVMATTADGIELTGVHVPSDQGAPVVLHLLESGMALADSRRSRDAFRELSRAGFASVAFDYRGVGWSGGDVDASARITRVLPSRKGRPRLDPRAPRDPPSRTGRPRQPPERLDRAGSRG